MGSPLQTIDQVFSNKVFRIPDYQRGYAWQDQQIEDFWRDLKNLEQRHSPQRHYLGQLTLEPVSKSKLSSWGPDLWVIDKLGYKPYYVVDGQQRLMTIVILMQVILEKFPEEGVLLEQTKKDLREKYICRSKLTDQTKFFVFGYEQTDPGNAFLVRRIFGEQSLEHGDTETTYTANLLRAKELFARYVEALRSEDLESIFRCLTQKLFVNVYEVDDDLDVSITFETMNNRGLGLTKLELLKNRLIYLCSMLQVDDGSKASLRKDINETWKTIYEQLGRTQLKKLDDDHFLRVHTIMHFGPMAVEDFSGYLLNKFFTLDRVCNKEVGPYEIRSYIESLSDSAKCWYELHVPRDSRRYQEARRWMEKLSRLNYGSLEPLALSLLIRGTTSDSELAEAFKALERFLFLVFSVAQRRSHTGRSTFQALAHRHYQRQEETSNVIKVIVDYTESYGKSVGAFREAIDLWFRNNEGFYSWPGIRYFLFEYNLWLQEQHKEDREKIQWNEFSTSRMHETIEHILPQDADKDCWKKTLQSFNKDEQHRLTHSMGNLLPLSSPKNSALQNDCFDKKRDNDRSKRGYRYGSYCEIEVSRREDWTASAILERGLEMIEFLERRWGVDLGTPDEKCELLGLGFLHTVSSPPVP